MLRSFFYNVTIIFIFTAPQKKASGQTTWFWLQKEKSTQRYRWYSVCTMFVHCKSSVDHHICPYTGSHVVIGQNVYCGWHVNKRIMIYKCITNYLGLCRTLSDMTEISQSSVWVTNSWIMKMSIELVINYIRVADSNASPKFP